MLLRNAVSKKLVYSVGFIEHGKEVGMYIAAYRVDERLVHGQIMTSWLKYLQLKRIIVVDNQLAQDDFMSTVLSMSAPAGVNIEILSVDETAKRLMHSDSDERTMLLFKRISAALELSKKLEGTNIPITELNLGNLGSLPGRVQITKNIFLSDEEKEQIKSLQDMGVNVFLQMLYTDQAIPASQVLL